jgi:FkbM family methyltransferase
VLRLIEKYRNRPSYKYYLLKKEIKENLIFKFPNVIHIGANTGQAANWYNVNNIKVIWVEAEPKNFKALMSNILIYKDQEAIQALIGSENRENVPFYIANNAGMSSSIFSFGTEMDHKGLRMTDSISLQMFRLDTLFKSRDISKYNYWVVDVQGSEYEVLKGAGKLLNNVKVIEIEVSTRNEYLGGAKYKEVREILISFGFFPLWEPADNSHEDLIFIK